MHWALTARAVVALGRLPYRPPGAGESAADAAAIDAALAAMDVAHLADRPVPELSGGERARVLIARALAQEPRRAARRRACRRPRPGAPARPLPPSRRARGGGPHRDRRAARSVAGRALLPQRRPAARGPHPRGRRAEGRALAANILPPPTASRRAINHSTACRLCCPSTCCHDAARLLALMRDPDPPAEWGSSLLSMFRRQQRHSISRSRAAGRTAPSPGACSTACSRRRASTSPGSAPPAPAPSTPRRSAPASWRTAGPARAPSCARSGRRWPRRGCPISCASIRGSPASAAPTRWPTSPACSRPTSSTRWASTLCASCSRPTSTSPCCAASRARSC